MKTMLQHKVGLWMVIVAIWVGVFSSAYLSLHNFKAQLIHEKERQLQDQVDQVFSLIDYFKAQVEQQQLTRTEAQTQAANLIRALRYGKNGYFWINDLSHVLIVHPYRIKLEGSSMYNFQDKAGVYVYREFVNMANTPQGAGFFRYYRAKPGFENNNEQSLKISYVKRINDWNWVIGSGIYVDDIEKRFQQQLFEQISLWIALFFIMLFISIILMNYRPRDAETAA